jgi:hypothetical protein
MITNFKTQEMFVNDKYSFDKIAEITAILFPRRASTAGISYGCKI